MKSTNNIKLKTSLFTKELRVNTRYKEFIVYIPSSWSIAIVNNNLSDFKVIYLTSSIYYIKFSIQNNFSSIYFDIYSSTLLVKSLFTNSYYNIFFRLAENTLLSLIKPTFNKLKFKGKGYYIYKNSRNTITPQFGYSHRLYMYSYFNSVKFLGKTKILIFGFKLSDIFYTSLDIKYKRPINIFTGRGVRFARQIVYKKQGKVSSYR